MSGEYSFGLLRQSFCAAVCSILPGLPPLRTALRCPGKPGPVNTQRGMLMPRPARTTLTAVVIGLAAVVTLSADVRFSSTFKSLDAGGTSFAGKKVAALVMSNDMGMRVPAEE